MALSQPASRRRRRGRKLQCVVVAQIDRQPARPGAVCACPPGRNPISLLEAFRARTRRRHHD